MCQISFVAKIIGATTLCATIVPGDDGQKGQKMIERIIGSCYESCRSQRRELEGFPDFRPLLAELKTLGSNSDVADASDTFKVTTCVPSGALVIKNQFFEQFSEIPDFEGLVSDHNSRFNKDNLTLSEPEKTASSADDGQKKNKTEVMETDQPIKAETISALTHPPGPKKQREKMFRI